MASLKQNAISRLAKVQQIHKSLTADLSVLQQDCTTITKVTEQIAESRSASWMGYHAELYYRNFGRPPLGAEFSPQWGGIHGIPAGWQKRPPDEVKQHIEKPAGVFIAAIENATEKAFSGNIGIGPYSCIILSQD
jgi:hypothetical protein